MKLEPISHRRPALFWFAALLFVVPIVFFNVHWLGKPSGPITLRAPVASTVVKLILIPTATPPATVQPTVPNDEVTYLHSTKLAAHSALTLTLPEPWQVVELDAAHLHTALDQLKASKLAPPIADAVETLRTSLDLSSTVLAALWPDGPTNQPKGLSPSLTVAVLPRNDLSLPRYLEDVANALRGHNDVTVYENKIENALRGDGLPVATLHYTLGAGLTPNARASIDGYQVATFDAEATHLVLFTFTAPTPRYTELLPMFQAIIGTVQWK